jgi:hypothetical protein
MNLNSNEYGYSDRAQELQPINTFRPEGFNLPEVAQPMELDGLRARIANLEAQREVSDAEILRLNEHIDNLDGELAVARNARAVASQRHNHDIELLSEELMSGDWMDEDVYRDLNAHVNGKLNVELLQPDKDYEVAVTYEVRITKIVKATNAEDAKELARDEVPDIERAIGNYDIDWEVRATLCRTEADLA